MDIQKDTQTTPVEEAEIVEEKTVNHEGQVEVELQDKPRGSMNMIELATLINRYVADMEKLRDSLKMQNGMFNDSFANDKEYSDMNQKVKELNRIKNGIKQRILKTPAMEAVVAKIEELKTELKDAQEMLSGYLEEYQRVSGTNIVEGENGEIREIVPVYKLVKRSNK